MTRSSSRGAKRVEILIFGENPNDSKAIKELVEHHHPGFPSGVTIKVMRDPVSLTREAGERARRDWVSRVRAVVSGAEASGTTVRAVIIHQDADGHDNGVESERRIAESFARIATNADGVPVVPVVMIESWWFLYPDAVESLKSSWRGCMPRSGQNVERITSPKKELQRLTRGTRPQHQYAESDSAAIAAKIRELALEPQGSSESYSRFMSRVLTL